LCRFGDGGIAVVNPPRQFDRQHNDYVAFHGRSGSGAFIW
jgi:hypothetical protein